MINANYLNKLEQEGRAANTITAYKSDIVSFMSFANNKNMDTGTIREYLRQLHNGPDGLTPVTINRKIVVLKSYFNYLSAEGIIENNPADKIKLSKIVRNKPAEFLTVKEADNLLDHIKTTTDSGIKYFCIVTVFLNTGIRLSELVNLNIEDVVINSRSGGLKILGKGNKYRVIPLNLTTRNAITTLLAQSKRQSGPLFTNRFGNRISGRYINWLLAKYGREIKLEKVLSAHKLRHTFATFFYNKTKDIKALKDLLGHEDINTTAIYTHVTDNTQDLVEKLDINIYR